MSNQKLIKLYPEVEKALRKKHKIAPGQLAYVVNCELAESLEIVKPKTPGEKRAEGQKTRWRKEKKAYQASDQKAEAERQKRRERDRRRRERLKAEQEASAEN